LAPSVTISH